VRDFGSEQDSSHTEIKDCAVTGSDHRNIAVHVAVQRHIRVDRNARLYGAHQCPGVAKLLPTFQADLVSPFLNREHTAQLAVMTAEGEPENPK
jgi:hypothetical protein